jgi:hypothetical protein
MRWLASIYGYAVAGIVAMGFVFVALTVRVSHAQDGAVVPVDRGLCDHMKRHHVIRAGAPVGCERLRLVKFSYLGFDRQVHGDGEIMVMDAAADNVARIFTKLREIGFPIAKARLIDHYDGNDDASIADNNTSAFNFRTVAGTNSLSVHAYGLAIDINPVQNPYVQHSGARLVFSPPASAAYADRLKSQPEKRLRLGMAEAAIHAFADEGFLVWGGTWTSSIDYQHFQVSRSLAQQLARLSPSEAKALFRQHVERYRTCRVTGGTESSRSRCVALDGQL